MADVEQGGEDAATKSTEGHLHRAGSPATRAGSTSIIEMRGVSKVFFRGKEPVEVLNNLNLDVPEGSFEALMGPSGSGKSTLLNLIAGLDQPTSGTARVAGQDLTRMSDSQ